MALVVVVLGGISCYQTLHTGFRRIPTILNTAKLLPYYKHGPVWTSVTNRLRWYRPWKRAFIFRATSEDATKSGSARPSARKRAPRFCGVYLAILRAVRPLPREPSSRARESTKATLSRAAQKLHGHRASDRAERARGGAREGTPAWTVAAAPDQHPRSAGSRRRGGRRARRTHRRDGVRGRRQGRARPGGNEM